MDITELAYGVMFIVMTLTIIKYINGDTGEISFVKSHIDNNEYLVLNKSDKQHAADLLAGIKKDLMNLITTLSEKYPSAENVKRLKAHFNPNVISESDGENGYTSYTENKGEKIVFCLRSRARENFGELHEKNILIFVALHEMAHLASESYSTGVHNEEFFQNFKFLLNEAIKLGIYKNQNYENDGEEYCGIMVHSNPLF